MNLYSDRYWHIQMNKPDGKYKDPNCDPKEMLLLPQPVIATNYPKRLADFKNLPIGTIVLVRDGARTIALCRIISGWYENSELCSKFHYDHFRDVEVLHYMSDEDQPNVYGYNIPKRGTFETCSATTQTGEYINKIISMLEMNKDLDNYAQLLRVKKNIILQGAPGTGKTYTTASIAVRICNNEFTDFNNHSRVMEEYERLREEGQIAFCTFHQSLDYEDFVEGMKPVVAEDNGGITYDVEDGIFKSLCLKAQTKEGSDIIACIDKYLESIKGYENKKAIPTISGRSMLYVWWEEGNKTISTRSTVSKSEKAEQHSPSPLNIDKIRLQAIGEGRENNWPHYAKAFINAVKKEYQLENQVSDKPYVLIIDEINRGSISKIFGELITLLEADKRSGSGNHHISLKLPYSKEDFSVPGNLYIIGTMNTTDRSTGSIDYAVRRRFAFVTLESSVEVIREHVNEEVRDLAIALFEQINDLFIRQHKNGDFELEDLMVGHSYFMADDIESLKLKMRYEVVPLIKEYIKDGILRGKKDDEKYFNSWMNATCYYNKELEVSEELV